jgi:hypothetical protein
MNRLSSNSFLLIVGDYICESLVPRPYSRHVGHELRDVPDQGFAIA